MNSMLNKVITPADPHDRSDLDYIERPSDSDDNSRILTLEELRRIQESIAENDRNKR